MEGNIFDIQRFSIHDGPGIRTTVFLKGCNLRCKWCHNPESQSAAPQLMFYSHKCIGCGKCRAVCEHPDNCISCGKCVEVCPNGAREISGRKADVQEVMKTVLRDKSYYETSGGGVTVSGGEPLLQPDFVFDILSQCKSAGIHTAVETAGNVKRKVIERIMQVTDLFLYDIKGIDETKHRENTGVSNILILDNARFLIESGAEVRFRMPYIPGYNAGEVKQIAEFLGGKPFELMAYHSTGSAKYQALGVEYGLEDVVPPTREEMEKVAAETNAIYNYTGV